MNILDKIIKHKRHEVDETKSIKPLKLLEQSLFYHSPTVSMVEYLLREDRVGIIAEIKRSSPSTGILHEEVDIETLSIGYMQAGASALSILTDEEFFGGSTRDLEEARKFNYCPILRKDFIIDPYQIAEARSIGADCILLIARCLTPKQCDELASFAKSLGLEVLLEVHSREEIESHINKHVDIVGVNNRNLDTFTTDINHSIELAAYLPKELVRISESGIGSAEQIIKLKEYGYRGFLIGGYFMKQMRPALACKNLVKDYLNLVLS
jgi:indole-3-glycerol phosphate synthase